MARKQKVKEFQQKMSENAKKQQQFGTRSLTSKQVQVLIFVTLVTHVQPTNAKQNDTSSSNSNSHVKMIKGQQLGQDLCTPGFLDLCLQLVYTFGDTIFVIARTVVDDSWHKHTVEQCFDQSVIDKAVNNIIIPGMQNITAGMLNMFANCVFQISLDDDMNVEFRTSNISRTLCNEFQKNMNLLVNSCNEKINKANMILILCIIIPFMVLVLFLGSMLCLKKRNRIARPNTQPSNNGCTSLSKFLSSFSFCCNKRQNSERQTQVGAIGTPYPYGSDQEGVQPRMITV